MRYIPRMSIVLAAALFLVCTLTPLAGQAAGGLLPARVIRVHDGDTILVRLDGRRERVRLTGIDAPEIEVNRKFLRDMRRERRHTRGELLRLGREARDCLKRLAPPGSDVGLELDVQRRDKYGRLLAYVWVRKGPDKVMLNGAMLEAGLAKTMAIPPNVRHVKYFTWLERRARREGRGMWGGRLY